MEIRGLKQALHWLFLAVGIVSLLALMFSVHTYLGYAQSGYGLQGEITETWTNDGWLALRLNLDNPGGLDMELLGGNVTVAGGNTYPIPSGEVAGGIYQDMPVSLKAHKNITLVLWVRLAPEDGQRIDEGIILDLEISVPERDLRTGFTLEAGTGVKN